MNLKNKETTNCIPIRSFFPTGQVGQANNINKLKKFTTEYTEKNRTHREHRATPHPSFLLCLFKTQPTTPKLTMDGHPGKGVHLRPILQGLEVGMRSITDVLGL